MSINQIKLNGYFWSLLSIESDLIIQNSKNYSWCGGGLHIHHLHTNHRKKKKKNERTTYELHIYILCCTHPDLQHLKIVYIFMNTRNLISYSRQAKNLHLHLSMELSPQAPVSPLKRPHSNVLPDLQTAIRSTKKFVPV